MTSPRNGRRGSKRARNQAKRGATGLRLYGLHTVRAALDNPRRRLFALKATANALTRLGPTPPDLAVDVAAADELGRMVGHDAVHQGAVLECAPLDRIDGSELHRLADMRLVVVLDQVTDPHNVGAILRSAVALGAEAVLITARNAPPETGVLAKSASGALDHIAIAEIRNLGKALEQLADMGFRTAGLDSEGVVDLADVLADGPDRIALVMGAEGRGLREGTRRACTHLARLDMPGPIKSLNVSNAAALALYVARRALDGR